VVARSRPIVLPYDILPCQPTDAFPHQANVARPQIQTYLEFKGHKLQFRFPCVIDSGADYCMFPAQFGEALGIAIREGKTQATAGIGDDMAYFHAVKVYVEIERNTYYFDCYAGFMYSLDRIGLGLLGRHGFFELFASINFKQHTGVVELTPRESRS
jgi:hypothetical protein